MKAETQSVWKDIFPVIMLFVGWMLGIWGNILLDWRKRHKEKKEIRIGILEELSDTKYQIFSNYIDAITKRSDSEITEELSKRIRPYFEYIYFSGEYDYAVGQYDKKSIKELDDKAFHLYFLLVKKNYKHTKSYLYPEIKLPYIDSKYQYITSLGEGKVFLISQLKKEIELYNSVLQRLWFYYTSTFQNITIESKKILKINIDAVIGILPLYYERIITLIEKIEK